MLLYYLYHEKDLRIEIFKTKLKKIEGLFLSHLQKIINNKTTNADHMINKFSKNEDLKELYDK